MYDFSFCVPSSETANPAKNGTSRRSVLPLNPLTENFFNKLWWEMTLFEFNLPKDIPQNSKLNNGSLVEEVWKHEGMGGIYVLGHTKSYMRWESPKSTHTLHGCLIYLSHCITYTKPGKPNTVYIPGHLRSGAGAGIFHKTRHLLQPGFQQHTSWPRLSALTSILNTSMRL